MRCSRRGLSRRWCGRLFDVGGPVCFVRGRLKFLACPGCGACFPSAAFYMGDRSGRFNDAFADIGEIEFGRLAAELSSA